ncbi:cytochrome c3 family protein [Eggerthella sinensis]|uniref:Salivary glue protein Sgs-3 n=1 Tax=Eggerthella sinensis TaxID=242230 RepID=A0A3N0J307_9ACTN|nr:cytochrome c3 family protein [Eggerthella sinensis]MCB7038351.1 cytochrome c3 family protein [Eggerthella sinensis]RDB71427.1 salivary glue protein Sgs-3 [Eggerthella sinensis]RNM43366.1 salivary glue protein Sgs-3 [Eggerthella sinensis]
MSEEETKVEAATEATASDDSTTKEAAPKKKGKKWPIVVGVVVVVLIAAGAGFWVWHEQPSFCSAICHTPMDPYLTTYEQEAGQPGVDKWGNEVANSSSMMAVVHKDQGEDCLSCHVPTLSEQMSEGMNWVTGNYVYPLEERDTEMLTEARGIEDDAFCLNESCHNLTREDLQKATADMEFNPHVAQHGEIACSECHKAHRASVMYCTQCHSEAEVPEGWLTVAEANKLSAA